MWWIIWLLTIAASFFIARKTLKVNEELFDEELFLLIGYVIVGIIPIFNVMIYTVILLIQVWNDSKMFVSDLAQKIFGIKKR